MHFVGRTAASDHDALERLIAIVTDGWLLSQNARVRGDRDENGAVFGLTPTAPLSGNDRYVPEMICFADIPAETLSIHTAKYGRFGLAFRKSFLIPKGARPVCYVPLGARTQPLARYDDIAEDWDELAEHFELEVNPLFGGTTRSGEHGSPELGEAPAARIANWIGHDLLAFMKFFDPTLPDDDADNYYMEREWRCVRSIQFELDDIAYVFVAAGFRESFTDRFATLASKVRELS
jgi:hypothetical protein